MSILIIGCIGLILSGCTGFIGVRETDPDILKLREAIKHDPDDSQKHLALAGTYFLKYMDGGKKSYIDMSIQEAKEALRLSPGSGLIYYYLSSALMIKGAENLDEKLTNEARIKYNEALRITPELAGNNNFPPPYLYSGGIYFFKSIKDKKFVNDAIREIKEAIRINPKYAASHAALGTIYYSMLEEKELAELELKEAVRLSADVPDFHKLLGEMYREKIHSGEENWDVEAIEQGIKEYKEVIRLSPEDDEAHRELSNLYEHKGLYDLQIFEAKEAVRLNKSARNYVTLGNAYIRKEDYDQALNNFKEALKLRSDYAYPHYRIAFIYYLQNRFVEAIEEFERYYKLNDTPSTYAILWQYYSLKKMGKDVEAQKLLNNYAGNDKRKEWESCLIEYYKGKLTESELISKTRHNCDRCEAFFYIGSQYLLKNDKEKSAQYFKKTLNTNIFCYGEYIAARVRLEQLEVM